MTDSYEKRRDAMIARFEREYSQARYSEMLIAMVDWGRADLTQELGPEAQRDYDNTLRLERELKDYKEQLRWSLRNEEKSKENYANVMARLEKAEAYGKLWNERAGKVDMQHDSRGLELAEARAMSERLAGAIQAFNEACVASEPSAKRLDSWKDRWENARAELNSALTAYELTKEEKG